MKTSKYEPLKRFLCEKAACKREISLSLTQVESIVGSSLPKSAFKYPEWWSDQTNISTRPQAKAWIEAGYKVVSVSPRSQIATVRFSRQ